jgi:hypothetical protein
MSGPIPQFSLLEVASRLPAHRTGLVTTDELDKPDDLELGATVNERSSSLFPQLASC